MALSKLSLALIVTLVFPVVAAKAFTYDSRTNQSPATNLSTNSDKSTKIGNSRFSMKFSGGSSQQLGAPSANNRFLPSNNSSFYSPYQGLTSIDSALGNRH